MSFHHNTNEAVVSGKVRNKMLYDFEQDELWVARAGVFPQS